VTAQSRVARAQRVDRVDYVASQLLPRATLLVRLLVKRVRSTEISRTEAAVLNVLSGGPRRVTELAELEGLAQPTVTILINRLEQRGWVKRERLPDDGRVVMVAIKEAGTVVLETFRDQFAAALRTDLEQLPDEQLAALHAATETLGSFIENELQGEGRALSRRLPER
jgi:DNA-binding MarR family transcriptional regulator